MSSKIMEAKNLVVGYHNIPVRDNINFSIDKGSYVCVIGENGAGKSTLIKTILGIIPPISGKLEIKTLQGVGYLMQQLIVPSDFPASVFEVVLSGSVCKTKFRNTKLERHQALDVIETLGLSKLKNKCFRELSGGQKQRVLLARALCASSDIIVLDEPVAGLDPDNTKLMYELIEKVNQNGTTVIMISHDMQGVLNYATHVLHIGSDNYYKTVEGYRLDMIDDKPVVSKSKKHKKGGRR